MILEAKAFGSYSVKDSENAKAFYGQILGLKVTEDQEMGGLLTLHLTEGPSVLLYPKPDHTPASFTVLNFPVDDIEQTVQDLTEKGVVFEKYEGDLQTDPKGIFRGQGPLIAWFKDPSGNILSVIEER